MLPFHRGKSSSFRNAAPGRRANWSAAGELGLLFRPGEAPAKAAVLRRGANSGIADHLSEPRRQGEARLDRLDRMEVNFAPGIRRR